MLRPVALFSAALLFFACSCTGPEDPAEATLAAVDGPVVVSGLTPDSDGEDADVVGTIMLNPPCLELRSTDGNIYGVAWPAGTTWDEDEEAVVLSNGSRIGDGDRISGAGGYRGNLDEPNLGPIIMAAAQECGHGTIVVLNGDPDDIVID